MSTIRKLEIRGIRSFGVESDDVQRINFQSPLTLIVGQNGCGKTTVIECLKYGITGEVPPGTNRGIGFVHDPKIFNNVESLGQVKLMVQDFTGSRVTATRSMKISHRNKNPKFETLDATVTMENVRKGSKANMTRSRADDVNNDMCDAMGVSKAIINNVIFCHQEDSNWPLEEPKELKKKFDAIFGTTEYNQVIDKLIKMSKEYTDRQKEKQGDLKLLENVKGQAEVKQMQLENSLGKQDELRRNMGTLEEETEPILKRLEKLAMIEQQYGRLVAREIEFKSKIESKQEQQRQLRAKIVTVFHGSLVELEGEIRLFQQSMDSKSSELENTEDEMRTAKSQENSLRLKLQGMDVQRIEFTSKMTREQETLAERGTKLMELCSLMKLPAGSASDYERGDKIAVGSALKAIKEGIRSEETKVQIVARDGDEEDMQAQMIIDHLREKKAKLEGDVASKQKQISEMTHEITRVEKDISSIERSAETLKTLSLAIDQGEREYEALVKSCNIAVMKEELTVKKIVRDEMQDNLDRIDERITALNEFAVKEREVTLKEHTITAKESELRRIRSKHSDNLRRLFPDRTVESNYKRALQDLYDEQQKQIKTLTEQIRRSQAIVTEAETSRKSQKQQLDRLERELTEAEERIYDACKGNAFDEVLAKLKEKIHRNNLEHGEARSAEVLYKKYISKIEDDSCCPVCHKEMGKPDAQEIRGELSDEIRRLPDKIETLERQLKRDQQDYDKLLSLKPVAERVEQQKVELAKLKEQLQETARRLTSATSELEEYQLALSTPNANVQLINSMAGDMGILDEAGKELERLKDALILLKDDLTARIPADQSGGLNLEESRNQREKLKNELKLERTATEQLQNTIDTKTEEMNDKQAQINKMKAKKLQLQESVQSLDQMRAKVGDLITKISSYQQEMHQAQIALAPLRDKLDRQLDEKQRAKDVHRQKLRAAQQLLEELKRKQAEIDRLTGELDELAALNLLEEFKRFKLKYNDATEEHKRKVAAIERKAAQIDELKKEISNQVLRKRDLQDNCHLKQLEDEVALLTSELDALLKSMGDMNLKTVQRERVTLIDKRDELQGKRSELNGQVSELQVQVNALRKELERSEFRNAVRNFRKAFDESVVLRKVATDLQNYRKALEWAMLKYHTEKMEEINRSIYSLWRDIYRGNDIDYIRIKTEDESKTEKSDKRRVYSYGVVQAKNDVEIDMRGRCSAGQKVLASIIIRMALAETFSNNCGVMALDEPTTNLDRDNIASLCESLRRIVTEREGGNFLLVVITHDEEFVTKLEKCDTYYRVSRNADGKSVIREEQL